MVVKKVLNIWKKGYDYSHKKLISRAIPKINNIELTNACAFKCEMCPRQFMKRKIGFMDIKLFEKIINQANYNTKVALHFFGDPLLHPEFDKAIKLCKQRGIKTSLSTNPTSLTDDKIKKLLDSRIDYLHISLDGASKKTYEEIRKGKATYEKALERIEVFLREKRKHNWKPLTEIAIIRMKKTEKEIDSFVKKWSNVDGIDKVQVKEFIVWGGGMDSINELASEFSHLYKRKEYYPCFWLWSKLVVLWDGKVVPCCSDFDGKCILGDLNDQSLAEIWNNKKMQQLRKMSIENSFPKEHLCYRCREREGFKPSKLFPMNVLTNKRLNFKDYFKYN